MIINPSPELENFIINGSADSTPELILLLKEKQISFEKRKGSLFLDRKLEILREELLVREMPNVVSGNIPVKFEIYRDIDSTNTQVLKSLNPGQLYICVAERQSAGKGRRGRRWISPFGRNVYLSVGRFMNGPMSGLEGLPIVAGMQAVDILRELGLNDVGLKWPNDLLLDNGKLGGILVETKSQEEQGIGVVIGLGINLALSIDEAEEIDQAWSVVNRKINVSRNLLAGRFVERLSAAIDQFERDGFSRFAEKWSDYNLYEGKTVKITRGKKEFKGLDRGIDKYGNLLLETEVGLQAHNSGEVSLRLA